MGVVSPGPTEQDGSDRGHKSTNSENCSLREVHTTLLSTLHVVPLWTNVDSRAKVARTRRPGHESQMDALKKQSGLGTVSRLELVCLPDTAEHTGHTASGSSEGFHRSHKF